MNQNGLKSDLVAHDNHHYNNIYAYLGESSCFAVKAANDYCYNSTCVIDTTIKQLSTYGQFWVIIVFMLQMIAVQMLVYVV